jgi:hypothetical protein
MAASGTPPTNLFLACTPLQILNCAEARDRFHAGENNYLIMFHSPRAASARQAHLHRLADATMDAGWTRTWNLRLTRLTQLFFPLLAAKLRRTIGPCQTLYTGGFQTQQRHMIHTVPHQQLVVVDGGAGVLQSAINTWRQQGSRGRGLRQLIPGLKTSLPDLDKARFFSSYLLDVEPDRVLFNDYRSLRNRVINGLPVRDEIVFLSQPLERDLGVTIDAEASLQAALQYHGVTRYRWILHPRETSGPPGAEKLPYLAEFFGLQEGYLPKAFVTWMSSAARTLPLIYGRPVTCIDMQPALPVTASAATREELSLTYADFAAAGAVILPLPGHASLSALPDSKIAQRSAGSRAA